MFKENLTLLEKDVRVKRAAPSTSYKKPRFDSIDYLRGIVMVLMALDHVRDYFTGVRFDPLDLSQTTVQLFLTRWITHFCAPVFVFLAGTGAFLSMGRGKSKGDVSKFLLSRGLWLIFLELTVVRFGWTFGFDYSLIGVQVIWAIGWSMIVLSFLIHFPLKVIAAFSLVMIFAHNLFDGISHEQLGSFSWLWVLLHEFNAIDLGNGYTLLVVYPLIPWIGVMAAGYCFGTLYNLEVKKRRKILFLLGTGMITGFILLRLFDFYGDTNKWINQQNFIFTILDFIDTTKYPPSLLFLLMTLGPSIFLLSFLENLNVLDKSRSFFLVFGRVPLFYYILHIFVIHLLAVLVANAMGYNTRFMFDSYPFFWKVKWGYSLMAIYLAWFAVVISLYPICNLYNNVKKQRKYKWLSYL